MMDRAHDLAAVADDGSLHVAIGPHKMWRMDIGVGIDSHAAVEIQGRMILQKLHIGAVVAVDGTNVLPVAGELIGKQSLSRRQKLGDNILAEVMGRGLVLMSERSDARSTSQEKI